MAFQTLAIPLGYGAEGEEADPLPVVPTPTGSPVVSFRVGGDPGGEHNSYYELLDLVMDDDIVTYAYSNLDTDDDLMFVTIRLSESLEDEQRAIIRMKFDYPTSQSVMDIKYKDNGFGAGFLTFSVPFQGGSMPPNSFAVYLANDEPTGPFWEKFTLAHEVA